MASDFTADSTRRARIAGALRFQEAPRIMGIVNATDDSFYAGSRSMDNEAVANGLAMWDAGATWVDVGGESTRPGAAPVDIDTEVRRVLPVIQGLRAARPDGLISIDTRHAEVAKAALAAGADMVNDVSGLRDPAMLDTVLASGCAVCVMHMQGDPGSMQNNPVYADVVGEVSLALEHVKEQLIEHGHPEDLIVLDPGIGFGKTQRHNIDLLRAGKGLMKSEGPLLWGVSRKSIVGHLTGQQDPADRLYGTLGLAAVAFEAGVDVVRVHDVGPHHDLFTAMQLGSTQPEHVE